MIPTEITQTVFHRLVTVTIKIYSIDTSLKFHLFGKVLLRNADWQDEPRELDRCSQFDECNVIIVGLLIVVSVGEDCFHFVVNFSTFIH